MSRPVEHLSQWIYGGVWGVLAGCFRVPKAPPTLPVRPGEFVESFRPAQGFLKYLKLHFWVFLVLIDGLIFVVWAVVTANAPVVGMVLAPVALFIAVVPDVIAYIAIHLRYDTTWYVVTDRSLRVRRGIWIIHETTITFENIQNVTVTQGPLQRWFGIANVLVDTAGGGGGSAQQAHGQVSLTGHRGLIEGIADASRIRDLLLARLRRSRTAGLGDEVHERPAPMRARPAAAWRPEHLAALREIREALREAVGA